jgi:hypothetical protein
MNNDESARMDNIAPLGNETISDQEANDTERLINRMRDMMARRDAGTVQQRDVHMKMHGLLRAEFTVEANLPPELQVGLFATPVTYKAWVRYSNSASAKYADSKGDIRGMGIKLLGVPGKKVLPSQADAPTHDFNIVTAANFPARDAAQTDVLVKAVIGSIWAKLGYALTHPLGAWVVATTMVKHANLLQQRYFSVTPFLFGTHAVKYVALPRAPAVETQPFNPQHDFLRDRLKRDLDAGDARFDFCVQFQRDEDCMPLDNPFRTWSQELSPPRKVATIRILQQEFDTEARRTYGENLSITPWHCLPEHRPLGALNRARRAVYETLSAYRHERNQVPRIEPDAWEV